MAISNHGFVFFKMIIIEVVVDVVTFLTTFG